MIDSHSILTQLIFDLYRRVAQSQPLLDMQIRLVDSPKLAQLIFNNSDIFIKNYSFLEKLSIGRMSVNGLEWRKRAELTQHFYHQSTHRVSDDQIEAIYLKNLKEYPLDQVGQLRKALIQSAIEVISLSYGLLMPIPWDSRLIEKITAALQKEQIAACLYSSYQDQDNVDNPSLNQFYIQLIHSWYALPELKDFLERFSIQGNNIEGFDAAGELVQNLFAASETTASSLMWAIEILGRKQDVQKHVREKESSNIGELFIDEVLRLYPPLPFLTRMVIEDCSFEGVDFKKNEQILISIVGINCHRDYWTDSLDFHLPRKEFMDKTYKMIAYKPFISGPRVCGGMKLARRELRLALKAFMSLYIVKPIETPFSIVYGLTCRPATPLEYYLDSLHL